MLRRKIQSTNGYTLLESLFALLLFSVVAFSMPLCIRALFFVHTQLLPTSYYEWTLFTHEIQKECRNANDILLSDTSVRLSIDGEEILYEQYGLSIRRRVDRKGHEIILQNIQEVHFTREQNGFTVSVMFKNGKTRESTVYLYKGVDTL